MDFFRKIRGSWAQVGNDLPIGITDLSDIIGAGGKLQAVDVYNRGDLKPEISNSIEFGLNGDCSTAVLILILLITRLILRISC